MITVFDPLLRLDDEPFALVLAIVFGVSAGALLAAFLIGAGWAIRGRAALRSPTCRRCGWNVRGHVPGEVPSTCTECGSDLTRNGAIRWFRFRRQGLTLLITLPVVLLGGITLSAVSVFDVFTTTMSARQMASNRSGTAAEPGAASAASHARFTDVQAGLDEVLAARSVTSAVEAIRRLQDGLNQDVELFRQNPQALREFFGLMQTQSPWSDPPILEVTSALQNLAEHLVFVNILTAEEFEAWDKTWSAPGWLTAPRRVHPGSEIVLAVVGAVPTSQRMVRIESVEASWMEEEGGRSGRMPADSMHARSGGARCFPLQAPSTLGMHEVTVRWSFPLAVSFFEAGQEVLGLEATAKIEVGDGPEYLVSTTDARVSPFRRIPSDFLVSIVPLGDRWLIAIEAVIRTGEATLHGSFELDLDGTSFTVPIDPWGLGFLVTAVRFIDPPESMTLGAESLPESLTLRYLPGDAAVPPTLAESASTGLSEGRGIVGWWARPAELSLVRSDKNYGRILHSIPSTARIYQLHSVTEPDAAARP